MKSAGDKFQVFSKIFLNSDTRVLFALYKHIVGLEAVMLYNDLLHDLGENRYSSKRSVQFLMEQYQSNLEEINKYLDKLSAVNLIDVYYGNGYLIELHQPLNFEEVFADLLLNKMLKQHLSADFYQGLLDKYGKHHYNLNEFKKISKTSREVFNLERKVSAHEVKSTHDYDELIILVKRFGYNILNDELENIIYLLTLNNVSVKNAFRIINDSLNHNRLNEELFVQNLKKMRGKYFVNSQEEIISKENYLDFLQNEDSEVFYAKLCRGKVLNKSEKDLIKFLRKSYHFSDSVINVLLDYIYKSNDRNMNPKYIKAIASVWYNHAISDANEAMKIAKKMYHGKVEGPKWLNDHSFEEADDKTQKEMEKLIEEMVKHEKS